MAHPGGIGDGRHGPVAESVDAGAVHRSLSWFKSRPGLQPSLASRASVGKPTSAAPACPPKLEERRRTLQYRDSDTICCRTAKMPVDECLKTLSRLRNLV